MSTVTVKRLGRTASQIKFLRRYFPEAEIPRAAAIVGKCRLHNINNCNACVSAAHDEHDNFWRMQKEQEREDERKRSRKCPNPRANSATR